MFKSYKRSVLLAVAFLAASISFNASAQSTVIRGEVAAGQYANIGVDSNGILKVQGYAAVASTASGAPVRIGLVSKSTNTVYVNGQISDPLATVTGALVVKPYGIPEQDWTYASASGGVTTTSDVVLAAGVASTRNYVTSCQFQNASATPTEIVIKDNATVIWRGYSPANSVSDATFVSPIKTSGNVNLNFATITAAVVYVNCQGFKGP